MEPFIREFVKIRGRSWQRITQPQNPAELGIFLNFKWICEMGQNTEQRKQRPYWFVLLSGMLIACVAANAITFTLLGIQSHLRWKTLGSPPSGAVSIINANDYEIWVETRSGKAYTASIGFCGHDLSKCREWKEVRDRAYIPPEWSPLSRGKHCNSLQKGMLPFDPSGRIIECVYSNSGSLNSGDENYFVLLRDGSIKFWIPSLIDSGLPRGLFDLSTVLVPFMVAIVISLVYLLRFIIQHSAS